MFHRLLPSTLWAPAVLIEGRTIYCTAASARSSGGSVCRFIHTPDNTGLLLPGWHWTDRFYPISRLAGHKD